MRLGKGFYTQDVLELAPALIGKVLVRVFPGGEIRKYLITEVEAYRGEEDLACHAAKGRTART
ncbi:MAG: DNA-3-methyladenine glycosylase, partial [Bacteroidetes bacterium]